MRGKEARLFQRVLLLAVLCIAMTGCVVTARGGWPVVWVGEEHNYPTHKYYYYPDVDVYFDPVPGLYFWFGGDQWISGPVLPSPLVIQGRGVIRFRSDADRPYIVHRRVTERFGPGGSPGGPPRGSTRPGGRR